MSVRSSEGGNVNTSGGSVAFHDFELAPCDEFRSLCGGYEVLCAGILKMVNASNSRVSEAFIASDVRPLVEYGIKVGEKICKDFLGEK